jgi:hypothetical protein
MTAMTRSLKFALLTAAALCALAPAAQAQSEIDVLNKAIENYNDGKNLAAAQGFYQIEETGTVADNRFKAEYYLAQSLNKLGLGFGAFFYYGQIIKIGPGHPYYFKAVEGAVNVTEAYGDEVLGPNVLNKAYNQQFVKLPPDVLFKINYYIALLSYRGNRPSDANDFVKGVLPESAAYAQAQYLMGLLSQRADPAKAVQIFKGILAIDPNKSYKDLREVKELATLALGRSLYGLQRFSESSDYYTQLPRFSRHWDEALFEGAYADLLNDDPGGALGRLHALHSPHLSDEFAPESLNLTAIIYFQNCLYPQVREALGQFDREYVPMRDQLRRIIESKPPFEAWWALVAGAQSPLPLAVQHHLLKNERMAAMLNYIAKLDAEAARVKANPELAGSPLGLDLSDLIAKQRNLVVQVAGKFIQVRLVDLAHLIDVLDGDKEIIAFETTKAEKDLLEGNVNVGARLAAQNLYRPQVPETGYEYWPFDGEYWPDEIGYYKYTLKNACPLKKKDE